MFKSEKAMVKEATIGILLFKLTFYENLKKRFDTKLLSQPTHHKIYTYTKLCPPWWQIDDRLRISIALLLLLLFLGVTWVYQWICLTYQFFLIIFDCSTPALLHVYHLVLTKLLCQFSHWTMVPIIISLPLKMRWHSIIIMWELTLDIAVLFMTTCVGTTASSNKGLILHSPIIEAILDLTVVEEIFLCLFWIRQSASV